MATMTRNVQPGLLALGVGLLAVGAVVLLLMGWQTVTADPTIVGGAPATGVNLEEPPSRVWAVVAGLLLAAGGAAIGIGLNRWYARK
jgi:hypothetical protein